MNSIITGWETSYGQCFHPDQQSEFHSRRSNTVLLLRLARQYKRRLYAVIDLAKNEDATRHLLSSKVLYESLYRGTRLEKFFNASPIIADCSSNRQLVDYLTNSSFGKSSNVWFLSAASLENIARHFRKFLFVGDEYGTRVLFRFYDPRVFYWLITASTNEELSAFLQGVDFSMIVTKMQDIALFDHQSSQNMGNSNAFNKSSEFSLSKSQYRALKTCAKQTYSDELADRLLEKYGSQLPRLSYQDLVINIFHEIDKAKALGLSTKKQASAYVELVLTRYWGTDRRESWSHVEHFLKTKIPATEKHIYLMKLLDSPVPP